MADTNLNIILKARDDATKVLSQLNTQLRRVRTNIQKLGGTVRIKGLTQATKDADGLKQKVEQGGRAVQQFDKKLSPISAKFERAGQSAETLAQSISNSRGQLLATAATATALVLAFKNAADSFFEIELAIAEVSTLVDSSVISNQELTNTVIDLSNAYGVANTEVAKGLYQAISAGATAGAEANELLGVALKTSIGGLTDVETAVDGLTTILNAFGKNTSQAGDVADVLFTTMKNGKTTIEELSQRFFQVAPLASSVGASFEEVSAAVIALTLQGTPTRVAMTQIRAALAGLSRQNPEVLKAFRDIGFESVQAAIAAQGMGKTFQDLASLVDNNAGKLQKLTGSIEGVQAILGTTGDKVELFNRGVREVANSAGAASEAFDKIAGTGAKDFEQSITRLANSLAQLGEIVVPTFSIIVKSLAAFTETITEFITGIGPIGKALVGLTTAAALLTAAITGLVVVFGFMTIAFTTAGPAIRAGITGFRGLALAGDGVSKTFAGIELSSKTARIALLGLRTVLNGFGLLIAITAFSSLTELLIEAQEASDDLSRSLSTLEVALNRVIDINTGKVSNNLADIVERAGKQTDDQLQRTIKLLELQQKKASESLRKALKDSGVELTPSLSGINDGGFFEEAGKFVGILGFEFGALDGSVQSVVDSFKEFGDAVELNIDALGSAFGADAGAFGIIDDVEVRERLDNAKRGVDLITVSLERLRKVAESRGLSGGGVKELPRPFEEMTNSIIAARKQIDKLNEINLDRAQRELEEIANVEIGEATRVGDFERVAQVRSQLRRAQLNEQLKFDKIEEQNAKLHADAQMLIVVSQNAETVEQERKKTDQLRKIRTDLAKLELDQLIKREEAQGKALSAERKALEALKNEEQALNNERDRSVISFRKLREELEFIEREALGESEISIAESRNTTALSELNSFVQKIIREGGKVTDEQVDRLKELESEAVSTTLALARVDPFFNTGRSSLNQIESNVEKFNRLRSQSIEAQKKEASDSAAFFEKQLEDTQAKLAATRLKIPTILDLDDKGLTQIQQAALQFFDQNFRITPKFNKEAALENFKEISDEINKIILGFAPLGKLPPEGQKVFSDDLTNEFNKAIEKQEEFGSIVKDSTEKTLEFTRAVQNLFGEQNRFSDVIKPGLDGFKDGLEGAVNNLREPLKGVVGSDQISDAFTQALGKNTLKIAQDLADAIAAAISNISGVNITATPIQGFSGGGQVFGAGTSTSDSIPARLSRGEFVIQAEAVKRYGANLFNALNNMNFSAYQDRLFDSIPRFASGGLVSEISNRNIAGNDVIRDVVDVNLTIQGQRVRLQGNRAEVAALAKAAKTLRTTIIGG